MLVTTREIKVKWRTIIRFSLLIVGVIPPLFIWLTEELEYLGFLAGGISQLPVPFDHEPWFAFFSVMIILWPASPFSLFGYYALSQRAQHLLYKLVIFAVVEVIVYFSFYLSDYPSYLNATTWLLSALLGPTCIMLAIALMLTRFFRNAAF